MRRTSCAMPTTPRVDGSGVVSQACPARENLVSMVVRIEDGHSHIRHVGCCIEVLRGTAEFSELPSVSPTLEGWILRHPPEIFELGDDAIYDGETGERSLFARLVDRV